MIIRRIFTFSKAALFTEADLILTTAESAEEKPLIDALHVAAAEAAKCDFLVTTDDKRLKKSKRHQSQLMVNLHNPIVSLP